MNTKSNLQVHAGGPLLSYSTSEEYAAALKANHDLMAVVDTHNQEKRDAQRTKEEFDQFLYGQNFETEPEVWDLSESCFEDEGLFGPTDL